LYIDDGNRINNKKNKNITLEQVEVANVMQFVETIQGAEFRCASCGCRIGERFLDGSSFPGTPAARTGKPERRSAYSGKRYWQAL
jgi:hypothetical protein